MIAKITHVADASKLREMVESGRAAGLARKGGETCAVVSLFWYEFEEISEYSGSLPSGTVPGKVWRRECNDGWILGLYGPLVGKRDILIYWLTIELKEGPVPRGYEVPDWDNFAGWQRQNGRKSA